MTRLHAISPTASADDLGVLLSWCGIPGSRLTRAEDLPDRADACRLCLRIMARAPRPPRAISLEEAFRDLAHLLAGPPVEAPPRLTPELWARMDCRRGVLLEEERRIQALRVTPATWLEQGCSPRVMRCRCDVCRAEEQATAERIRWDEDQQHRPHRRHRYVFGSLNAALTFYADWRAGGGAIRSWQGSMQARANEAAQLGTQVQTTQRTDRDALEYRRAGFAADIERALRYAFAEPQARHGLSVADSVLLVVRLHAGADAETVAGRAGLAASEGRSMLRHARRVLTIELAAGEEYLPMPRAKTGLVPLVERRREELRAKECGA